MKTIAAISTPPGTGGIGIIRISGSDAFAVIDKLFRPYKAQKMKNRYMHLGMIVDTSGPIDQVLAVKMKAPHTYTGEDMVEIHSHGGRRVLNSILDAVLACGATLAEPGEFTKRAFLNGKIDLSQAEAIADMIQAKSDRAVRLSARALSGTQSKLINKIQDALSEIIVSFEANADFPEYETEADFLEQKTKLIKIDSELAEVLKRASERSYEGWTISIVGEPNVGKSSLLNALVCSDRAIVSDIPGTTRDVVEAIAEINGVTVRLADTAGLRESADMLENLGINRTRQQIQDSDLVLLVIDGTKPFYDSMLNELTHTENVLPVINKADRELVVSIEEVKQKLGIEPIILSAHTREGLDELRKALESRISEQTDSEDVVFFRKRQIESLKKAKEYIQEAIKNIDTMPVECILVDLKAAWKELGLITGTTADERIIDMIFSSFCIGK